MMSVVSLARVPPHAVLNKMINFSSFFFFLLHSLFQTSFPVQCAYLGIKCPAHIASLLIQFICSFLYPKIHDRSIVMMFQMRFGSSLLNSWRVKRRVWENPYMNHIDGPFWADISSPRGHFASVGRHAEISYASEASPPLLHECHE